MPRCVQASLEMGRARAFIHLLLAGYQFHAGQIHAGMLVVEFMLADEGPGDGGVAVVQGSRERCFLHSACRFQSR